MVIERALSSKFVEIVDKILKMYYNMAVE